MSTVTIAGAGTTTVTIEDASPKTARSAIKAALKQLGRPTDDQVVESLDPVVNGEDATLDTPVSPEDHVAAAPAVANG